MKTTGPLERLFRAAAAAWPPAPAGLPFATEARLLDAWRRGPVERDDADLLALFRRGLVLAGVLAVLAVVLSLNRMPGRSPDVLTTANAVANLAVLP